jgi:tetratricopeptide (TPR) repeat protein
VKSIQSLVTFFIFLAILSASSAPAQNQSRIFLDGVQSYHDGNFSRAIESFAGLTRAGILNGKLFYNLGNAYFKNDDLGHALLWYARAAALIPRDPDLKFNAGYARGMVKDKSENKVSGVLRILFFWDYLLGKTAIQWIAAGLNLVFWLFLGVQLLKKNRSLHRVTLALAPFVLILSFTAFYHFYDTARGGQAIILDKQVAVRSGFTDNATQLFVLHAGTRVEVEDKRDEFLKICFSADKIGWIKAEAAGVI